MENRKCSKVLFKKKNIFCNSKWYVFLDPSLSHFRRTTLFPADVKRMYVAYLNLGIQLSEDKEAAESHPSYFLLFSAFVSMPNLLSSLNFSIPICQKVHFYDSVTFTKMPEVNQYILAPKCISVNVSLW